MASTRFAAIIAFAIATILILTIASLPIAEAKQRHNRKAWRAQAKLSALKQRMAVQADEVTYEWQTGTWSDCSATCGAGHMTRSVSCFGSDGSAVDDTLCDSDSQPKHSEKCELQSCASWTYGTWSDCSASCGTGTKSRSVTCINHAGTVVDASECTDTAPAESEECTQADCPVWTWSVGDWSTCSATCGEGFKSRQRECVNQNGEVSDSPHHDCDASTTFVSQKACKEQECTSTQAAQGDTSSTQSASVTTAGDTESASLSTGTQIAGTTGSLSDTLSPSAIAALSGYTGPWQLPNNNTASAVAPTAVIAVVVIAAAVMAL